MKNSNSQFLRIVICVALLCVSSYAQKSAKTVEIVPTHGYVAPELQDSSELRTLLNSAIGEVLNSYPAGGFKSEDIAATLIDVRDPKQLRWADFRGDQPIYPASVVKMFYMTALQQQLQDGKVKSSPELMRGLKDMIVDSSNEATQYILDVLTDTSSGAELPKTAFEKWQFKRNRVNRYFTSMGFTKINVNQKTFCEDAYGIEQQSRNYKSENRNALTTNATARLLAEIALGRAVNHEHSLQMMELMKRDPFRDSKDADDQSTGFTGKMLIDRKITNAKLWSKAGWTSKSRHDAAYIETPEGLKYVLVIFTENHASDREPIPSIAGKVMDGMRKISRQ